MVFNGSALEFLAVLRFRVFMVYFFLGLGFLGFSVFGV